MLPVITKTNISVILVLIYSNYPLLYYQNLFHVYVMMIVSSNYTSIKLIR